MREFEIGSQVRNKFSGINWIVEDTSYGRTYLTRRRKPGSEHVVSIDPQSAHGYDLIRTAKQVKADEALNQKKKEKEKNMALFQIEGTDTFCTYLATNSEGKSVVEIKGSGEVRAIDHKLLQEVVPYTIQVTSHSGQKQHFAAKKDFWNVNDVFPFNGSLYVVNRVDSRGGEGLPEVPNKRLAMVTE